MDERTDKTLTTKFNLSNIGWELLQSACKAVMSVATLCVLVSPEEVKSLDGRLMILGVILILIWVRK